MRADSEPTDSVPQLETCGTEQCQRFRAIRLRQPQSRRAAIPPKLERPIESRNRSYDIGQYASDSKHHQARSRFFSKEPSQPSREPMNSPLAQARQMSHG